MRLSRKLFVLATAGALTLSLATAQAARATAARAGTATTNNITFIGWGVNLLDGTLTYHGTYTCVPGAGFTDLDVESSQDEGLNRQRVDGTGLLGTAPTCNGHAQPLSVRVAPSESGQRLVAGMVGSEADFIKQDGTEDEQDDATRIGSDLAVLPGAAAADAQQPNAPAEVVDGDHVNGPTSSVVSPAGDTMTETGTYVCTDSQITVFEADATEEVQGRRIDLSGQSGAVQCNGQLNTYTITMALDDANGGPRAKPMGVPETDLVDVDVKVPVHEADNQLGTVLGKTNLPVVEQTVST